MTDTDFEPQGASVFAGVAIAWFATAIMQLLNSFYVNQSSWMVWLIGAAMAVVVSWYFYREESADSGGVAA